MKNTDGNSTEVTNMDDFESWYAILQGLANLHGENVSDRDAWYEDFETGKSPEAAFYDEYPEHEE
jgi:hypothetical protein